MKKFIQHWNFLKHFSLSFVISLCFLMGTLNIIKHLKMVGATNSTNGSITILSNHTNGSSALYISTPPSPFVIFVAFATLLIFLLALYIPIKKGASNRVNIQ